MSQEESRKPKKQILQIFLAALLPGLIFGGFFVSQLRHLANENLATVDNLQLRSAIAAFFTEYQRYPFRDPAEKFERVVLSDREIMGVLLGAEKYTQPDGINPRGISWCLFREAKPIGKEKYRGGTVIDSGGDGELWDPWGNHYRVIVDMNRDKRIAAPSWARTEDEGGDVIRGRVIAWSPGPDGNDLTAEDNIVSW